MGDEAQYGMGQDAQQGESCQTEADLIEPGIVIPPWQPDARNCGQAALRGVALYALQCLLLGRNHVSDWPEH